MLAKVHKFSEVAGNVQNKGSKTKKTTLKRKNSSTEREHSLKKAKFSKNEKIESTKSLKKAKSGKKKKDKSTESKFSPEKTKSIKNKYERKEFKPKMHKIVKNGQGPKSINAKSKPIAGKENKKKKGKESKLSSVGKAELFKMKKKERKALRQKSKKNFDLAKQLKLLWEELRRDGIEEERKLQLLEKVSALVKGHALQLIFAHDTVRVIECLVAVGTEAHRTMLFEELKESIIPLAKSRYAKFFLIKILKYGTQEQKERIMKAFHSKVIHLLKHTEAATVVETAFNECANATQRAQMVQEFYGPHFLFFKDVNLHNLKQLLEAKPDNKTSIIEHMKGSLEKVLQKGAHKHSIVHYVLREFMKNADLASFSDLIESIQQVAAEIVHTKDGSRVVMNCIWHGSAKARKAIIKSFKMHASKIAQEEYGHMTLLAIFDCVDDTRLVEKHIISEILKDGKSVFLNQYGRKVAAYLVSPRDPLYFHPDVINILKEGDNNATSKKFPELRISELRSISSPMLLKVLLNNMEEFLLDNACCLLISTLLKHSSGDCREVFQLLAKLVSAPYITPEENSMHFIESNSTSLLLKKLIVADKEKKESDYESFSEVLINEVPQGNFQSWIHCNRGAFLLVNLLETEIPSVVRRITKELKKQKKVLACKSYTGAKILLKVLQMSAK